MSRGGGGGVSEFFLAGGVFVLLWTGMERSVVGLGFGSPSSDEGGGLPPSQRHPNMHMVVVRACPAGARRNALQPDEKSRRGACEWASLNRDSVSPDCGEDWSAERERRAKTAAWLLTLAAARHDSPGPGPGPRATARERKVSAASYPPVCARVLPQPRREMGCGVMRRLHAEARCARLGLRLTRYAIALRGENAYGVGVKRRRHGRFHSSPKMCAGDARADAGYEGEKAESVSSILPSAGKEKAEGGERGVPLLRYPYAAESESDALTSGGPSDGLHASVETKQILRLSDAPKADADMGRRVAALLSRLRSALIFYKPQKQSFELVTNREVASPKGR
ncbi:hypothetical protein R3P38DRAFT_3380720 [Favolaschia claudopus]|uniref:Uncharacterized protein n=1 Tax=Favolaschia claudopus TaxID=2862362 RepID=A0AAV9Z1E0_9AGAR